MLVALPFLSCLCCQGIPTSKASPRAIWFQRGLSRHSEGSHIEKCLISKQAKTPPLPFPQACVNHVYTCARRLCISLNTFLYLRGCICSHADLSKVTQPGVFFFSPLKIPRCLTVTDISTIRTPLGIHSMNHIWRVDKGCRTSIDCTATRNCYNAFCNSKSHNVYACFPPVLLLV